MIKKNASTSAIHYPELIKPIPYFQERLLISNIKEKQKAHCISIK